MAILAVTVCLLSAYSGSSQTRKLWILLGSGFLLSTVGQIGATYYDLVSRTHTQTAALNSDYFFFAYGIPILLAVCSGGKDAGLRIFVWLDGAQALVAALLAYLQIFSSTAIQPKRDIDLRDQSHVFVQRGKLDSGRSCDSALIL